ncbi:MAG: LLM class F420-dependent oxidoreductase [Gammaproteobacteria bacterium]|nr:LLM class F420-dependent oxidoreductase [Gammaproteobacteria bacterium]MYE81261.1 LLM class F420-dependent oxidoreductase [Gammaproteobacteria bacterium]
MKLGIVFPHDEIGTDPIAIRDYAQGAEALGADHMMVYDHVLGADPDREGGWDGPYDKDVAFHEPFTLFSYMAAVTSEITFGTCVLVLPQRQTALVAKQAAQLAILSGNRFRMGIGVGWNTVEFEALDIPFARRGSRQAEQVELMRRLWTEDNVAFAGAFHTVDRASILPRPSRPIPIWFGGAAPVVLRRCGRLGDGWVPSGVPNEKSRQAIATIRAAREEAGLPWEGFGIQAQAQTRGGNPERWKTHHDNWRDLGCTHLAIVTHYVGNGTDVDAHLASAERYFEAVRA